MNRRLVPETNGRKAPQATIYVRRDESRLYRGAGATRCERPLRAQIRLKIEKKCAGAYTVLKFICMFAVLKIINHRTVTLSEAPLRAFFVPGGEEDTTASNPVRALQWRARVL